MLQEQTFEYTGFLKNMPVYYGNSAFILTVLPGAEFTLESSNCTFFNLRASESITGKEIKSLLNNIFPQEKVTGFYQWLVECVSQQKTLVLSPGVLTDDSHIIIVPQATNGIATEVICIIQNSMDDDNYFKEFNQQKNFMQRLYDVFPAPFYITDDKDIVVEYNEAAKKNIGLARENLAEASITNIVDEIELINEDYSIMQPEELGNSTAFEQKTVVEDVVTGLRVKGRETIEWYRTFAVYLDLPGYGVVGYNESITKQKNQEERILSLKNILNAIISSSTDNITFVDTENKVSLLNEAAFMHFSKINKRPIQIGEDVINIIPEDRLEIFNETLLEIKNKKQVEREHKVIYPDGSEVWLHRKFYPVYDEQNKYMGYVIYSSDISRQKEFELRLSKQHEKLKEIAKIQTEELIKPLATVLGLIKILIAKSGLDSILLKGLKESALQLETVIRSKTYMSE